MITKSIKAIIFDLDGTLADTIWAIRAAVNNTMNHYGYPEKDYDTVKNAIGGGARNLIKSIVPQNKAGDEEYISEVLKFYNGEYEKTYLMTDSCYLGMSETVTELHNMGYKLAILSNKPERFVLGLTEQLFPDGEISFAAGHSELPIKPDPASTLMVAGKLGVKPNECVFIGDSDVDIMTAKNAGMTSVGCSWGYRGAEVLRECGADIIVEKPEELTSLFPKYI